MTCGPLDLRVERPREPHQRDKGDHNRATDNEELVVVLNASLFCGHMAISSTIKDTALASAQKPRHLQVELFPKKERSTGIIHDRKVFGFTETLAQ